MGYFPGLRKHCLQLANQLKCGEAFHLGETAQTGLNTVSLLLILPPSPILLQIFVDIVGEGS